MSASKMESGTSSQHSTKKLKWMVFGLGSLMTLLVVMLTICAVALVKINEMPNQQIEELKITNMRNLHVVRTNNLDKEAAELQRPATEVPVQKMAEECTVIQHPNDQKVSVGSAVQLSCKFDRAVECHWLRRSTEIDIKQRYQYVAPKNQEGNNDCSINIRSIKDLDFGDWVCVGLFEDQSSVRTNAAQIIENSTEQKADMANNNIIIVLQPKNVQVAEDRDVTLNCEFNKEVDCAWLRRGEHIDIHGRYSYKHQQHSNICSIEIKRVKSIDQGEWQCSAMGDSESAGVYSSKVELTVK